ncbi:MAG TPA: hypothetical protein VER03_17945 [Bryobacteraceae bacterium]|nr:hypothetical protein [Bryobacteraceae bacterium]
MAKYDKAHAEFHGSCILRHTNVGLFLLQLYQMIRKNLPPLGSVFPSVSRLAAPPLVDSPGGSSEPTHSRKRSFHVELSEALQRFEKPDFNQPRLVVASTPEGIGGLTTACAHVFRRCESDHVCLWLDMNDISSTDNLFDVLLETAYYRLGLENWTPVSIADESQSRAGEIQRLVNSVSANWIVFLNARETPGLNLEISVDPHGWLDQPSASGDGDPSATADAFLELLHELCGPGKVTEEEKRQRRISVVLLCRNSANRAPLLNHLEACGLLGCHISLDDQSEEHIQFSPEEIVKNAIQWAEREPPRRRFLHALVLMQRPRFLATIWSSALLREPDRHAHDVSQWVRDLEVLKLVRRKEGGFIWLHARCREKLRKALRSGTHQTPESLQDGYTLESWTPQTDQAEIHNELARWYNKVLDASDAPPSAFEVVYHLCLAAASAMKHNPELSDAWIDEKVEAAAALLKTHAFLIQTHGYSRGSCRRLEYIRDTLCDRLDSMSKHRPNASFARNIGRLRKVCTEVMRAIAREVGEDVKAYHRQQELAFLYLSPTGPEFVGSWKHDLREWRNDVNKPVDRRSLTSDLLTRSWPQFSSDGEEVGAAMRWLRWSAMLAIGTRSYGVAGRALRRANDLVSLDSEGNVTSKDRQPLKGGSQQNLRMELLRIAEQQVALLLLEDSLERRLGGAPAEGRVTEIRNAVAGAMEIARHIRQRDHSSDSHNTTRAIWAESRLLMHQSICAARQINIAQEPTSYKAQQTVNPMGLLGDAEANLRLSDARRDRWELALVDLHRAEARLQEATAAPIRCTGGTPIPFGVLCRRLEEERPFRLRARERGLPRPDPGNIKERKVFRESYVPGDEEGKMKLFDDLRRARSLVGDAIRFLGRAEPELRERRRNVWWTTWFFERKLQAIALSIWASSFEKDTPIPFLGLEAAMRKTVTVADVLFEDASRMIRVDSYRLAAVLDSYASCAKALQIRQMLDPEGDRLFLRQERMQNELTKGIERLSAVHANRMNPQRFMSNKSGEVDARVNRYVELVIARCKRRAEELQETC